MVCTVTPTSDVVTMASSTSESERVMADETLMPDITDESVEQANRLLTFLVDCSVKDWNGVMAATLNEKELEINHKTVEEKLAEYNLTEPVGAVRGGTGIAKDDAGLPGEEGQRAIRMLKVSGRLVQCGRGRGKCLIVLNSTPVTMETFAGLTINAPAPKATIARKPRKTREATEAPGDNTEAPPTEAEDRDVLFHLKAARDGHRAVRAEMENLLRDMRKKDRQIAELEAVLVARDATINELENRLAERMATTWQ